MLHSYQFVEGILNMITWISFRNSRIIFETRFESVFAAMSFFSLTFLSSRLQGELSFQFASTIVRKKRRSTYCNFVRPRHANSPLRGCTPNYSKSTLHSKNIGILCDVLWNATLQQKRKENNNKWPNTQLHWCYRLSIMMKWS